MEMLRASHSLPMASASFTFASHQPNSRLKLVKATYLSLALQRESQRGTVCMHRGEEAAAAATSNCRKQLPRNLVTNHLSESSREYPQGRSSFGVALTRVLQKMNAIFRFCRPYVLLATSLQVISSSLLAIQSTTDLSIGFITGILQALIPSIMITIFIAGLNGITDINIDKINKPHAPLASGEISLTTAIAIVALAASMSLIYGVLSGSWPLIWLVTFGLFVGIGYSVKFPLLYWKGNTLTAILYFISLWGFGRQLAFFLHMQTSVLNGAIIITRPFLLSTAIVSLFAMVIAISKDICDSEGDKAFGIKTFSIMFGEKKTFWICIYFLQAIYVVGIIGGLMSTAQWRQAMSVICHVIMSIILWFHATKFDTSSKQEMHNFFMFVYKLYYVEHLLIPLFH